MAIVVANTNYGGEVLESILTKAATGNELVERGLIRMEPGISDKFSLPRMKMGQTLQKRKETPGADDAKGNATYSERSLQPKDFMAFATFNPRSFEKVWRPFQPTGNLVFAQLPADVQNKLLEEINKQVDYELGSHLINGEYGEEEGKLFDGFVKRITSDADKIVVTTNETTMVGKLQAVRKKIPTWMRNNPRLRYLMSIGDSDAYDAELSEQEFKGTNWTDTNASRFKGTPIEALAEWPDGLIVATLCGDDLGTNLWAGCNLVDDPDTILVDRLTNTSEVYFIKILMKMDTQVAFGEELVVLDKRSA